MTMRRPLLLILLGAALAALFMFSGPTEAGPSTTWPNRGGGSGGGGFPDGGTLSITGDGGQVAYFTGPHTISSNYDFTYNPASDLFEIGRSDTKPFTFYVNSPVSEAKLFKYARGVGTYQWTWGSPANSDRMIWYQGNGPNNNEAFYLDIISSNSTRGVLSAVGLTKEGFSDLILNQRGDFNYGDGYGQIIRYGNNFVGNSPFTGTSLARRMTIMNNTAGGGADQSIDLISGNTAIFRFMPAAGGGLIKNGYSAVNDGQLGLEMIRVTNTVTLVPVASDQTALGPTTITIVTPIVHGKCTTVADCGFRFSESTPTPAAIADGTTFMFRVSTNSTGTCTIDNVAGQQETEGGVSLVLDAKDSVEFTYDSEASAWIQTGPVIVI